MSADPAEQMRSFYSMLLAWIRNTLLKCPSDEPGSGYLLDCRKVPHYPTAQSKYYRSSRNTLCVYTNSNKEDTAKGCKLIFKPELFVEELAAHLNTCAVNRSNMNTLQGLCKG